MNFGALIIGDEILSGRRSDKHLAKVIELLGARGLKLSWARYAGDDGERLAGTLKQTFATGDVVLCFGGIGATPDDRTRQSAAAALGVELALHPQAEAEIRARFGADVTPERLQMGVFPVGSEIIPNPFNRIPGFSIRQHYFAPGFPVMAWPMMEWVLDTHYPHLFHAEDYVEAAVTVWDAYEGQLISLMQEITLAFPGATLFSLPTIAAEGERRSLELGMKGPAADVADAMARIRAALLERGLEWEDRA
ncbi:competence/damage-inducible protein A [Thauera sinica]|uniref:Competence/damage-inducible protein A n=1 Tax=Thauera sinica TaxID=2665146 RepID=A0ABW1AZA0_9RHOO|nr:molybdopterin-binding protein [Thauera sp. K11]ATE59053.1 competence/damage-inducible protein A [Thauera sp. K11]